MNNTEKYTQAIISANHTEFCLRQLPVKQAEKNLLNRTIKVLKPYVLMSEIVDEKAEKPFEDVYNGYIAFMNEVSTVKLHESLDVVAIIRAYKKDPNSIIGITRKILK